MKYKKTPLRALSGCELPSSGMRSSSSGPAITVTTALQPRSPRILPLLSSPPPQANGVCRSFLWTNCYLLVLKLTVTREEHIGRPARLVVGRNMSRRRRAKIIPFDVITILFELSLFPYNLVTLVWKHFLSNRFQRIRHKVSPAESSYHFHFYIDTLLFCLHHYHFRSKILCK